MDIKIPARWNPSASVSRGSIVHYRNCSKTKVLFCMGCTTWIFLLLHFIKYFWSFLEDTVSRATNKHKACSKQLLTHIQRRRKTNNHLQLSHKPYLLCTPEIRAMTCDGCGRHCSPTHAELSLKTTHSLHQGFPWISPAVQDSFPHKFPDALCQHCPLCYHIWSLCDCCSPRETRREFLGGSSKSQCAGHSPHQQSFPAISTSSPATAAQRRALSTNTFISAQLLNSHCPPTWFYSLDLLHSIPSTWCFSPTPTPGAPPRGSAVTGSAQQLQLGANTH